MIWSQEDTTIVNIYAPSTEAPKFIKQNLTELEGKVNNATITAKDFRIHLSTRGADHPDSSSEESGSEHHSIPDGPNAHACTGHSAQRQQMHVLPKRTGNTF